MQVKDIDEKIKELRKLRAEKRAEGKEARKAAAAERREARQQLATKKKRRGRGNGVAFAPPATSQQALDQMRRSFGTEWVDAPENPAVELISSESHLCARINTFHEGRWVSRRVGDDNVIAIVKLQDGTEETRCFTRSVLSATWKRC